MGVPYTYKVELKSTGDFYYGVRYAKDCHPSDLWVKYFTSSKTIQSLIEQYGNDAFSVQVRKTFSDVESALDWEHRVLRKVVNWKKCLNLHDAKSFSIEACSKGSRNFWANLDEEESKLRKEMSARRFVDTMHKYRQAADKEVLFSMASNAGKKGSQVSIASGRFQSEEWRASASRANTTWVTDGVKNKRVDNSALTEFLTTNTSWRIGSTKSVVVPDNKGKVYLYSPDGSKKISCVPGSEKYVAAINDGYWSKNGKHGLAK